MSHLSVTVLFSGAGLSLINGRVTRLEEANGGPLTDDDARPSRAAFAEAFVRFIQQTSCSATAYFLHDPCKDRLRNRSSAVSSVISSRHLALYTLLQSHPIAQQVSPSEALSSRSSSSSSSSSNSTVIQQRTYAIQHYSPQWERPVIYDRVAFVNNPAVTPRQEASSDDGNRYFS